MIYWAHVSIIFQERRGMVGARTRCKTYFDGPNGFKKRKIFIFDELTDLESCESFSELATFNFLISR
jgi:hypothetical protein